MTLTRNMLLLGCTFQTKHYSLSCLVSMGTDLPRFWSKVRRALPQLLR